MSAFHKFLVALGLAMPSKENTSAAIKSVTVDAATDICTTEPSDAVMPFDEHLLDRARTQWQFGDWERLAKLAEDQHHLAHHPQRAELRILATAGVLQTQPQSDIVDAKAQLKQSLEEGASREAVARMLIAGVHNTLGRVSALAGHGGQKSLAHLHAGLTVGMPEAEARLLARPRIERQLADLGLAGPQVQAQLLAALDVANAPSLPTPRSRPRQQRVQQLIRHDLGNAWAGNTINTVIFRHHGILTRDNTQYTAFYVDTHTLRLVQRDLANETLITFDLLGEYNLRDAHNSISLGIDRNGHLHICYDHHATQLRYRRSINSGDISAWTDELPMTGTHEEKVTYPTFILPHHSFPLTFLYRDGVHDKGTARLKTYDEATQTWTNHPQPILSGSEQKPWTSNPYWNHPAVGTDGSLHLSFVWRTHSLGGTRQVSNINIGYAWSQDNGLTWKTSQNRPYRLPITQVNAETIYPVSPGSNLINQTSMALDSHNRPHIVFYADDPDGIPQYRHLWFDGKVWRHQFVSQRRHVFSLEGGGTLQIPISRPEIVIDRGDNVYVITRGDQLEGRLAACRLGAPDYAYQHSSMEVLQDEDLGFAEPVIDRERWQQENVLSVLLQFNEQPDHDRGHRMIQYPVTLLDLQFIV